ncbi:hypothetical protein D931_00917 [Enterococcus faecium 13.SD.W.09]|nr:hypothetical protein D931_00917 [Enterococcus faecium 13.SD.W.09]
MAKSFGIIEKASIKNKRISLIIEGALLKASSLFYFSMRLLDVYLRYMI